MSLLDQLQNAEVTSREFTQLPEGEYLCQITDADIKEESNEVHVNLDMVIHSGEYTGRKLWYSPKVKATSKPNYFGMVKGQIYRAAGIESSDGKSLGEILQMAKGNYVYVMVTYSPNATKPDKPWQNNEILGVTTPL